MGGLWFRHGTVCLLVLIVLFARMRRPRLLRVLHVLHVRRCALTRQLPPLSLSLTQVAMGDANALGS